MSDKFEIPFVFGVRVECEQFTDRVEETARLHQNFLYGINTILISPRRMGKTSLVDKVCGLVASDKIKIVRIDVFGCRSEQDFINAFVTAVVQATSNKLDEWIENAKIFLSRFVPKMSFGPDPFTDFSISLEYSSQPDTLEKALQLPEVIAEEKGIKIVVCIDEFQQIGEFKDSITFQKRMRSVWQLQRNVSYCLYGSKKHLMEKMFQKKNYPFYRFGDFFYLDKISEEDWIGFICERFKSTGKSITETQAKTICNVTDRYSSYVQQLAWFVWLKSGAEVADSDVDFAINKLLDSNEQLFIQQTEELSAYQMNFLKAIISGVKTGFMQSGILTKYNLGTAANVTRLKKSLITKDLITVTSPGCVDFSDPILALWLKRRVFKI